MKIGLAGDDNSVAPPGLTEQIGTALGALKAFIGRAARTRRSGPWQSGYDALYQGVTANPHAPDSDAHKEWERGRAASERDFEW